MVRVRYALAFTIVLAFASARGDEPPSGPFSFVLSPDWIQALDPGPIGLTAKIRAAGQAASAVKRATNGTVMLEFGLPYFSSPMALRRRVESGSAGATLLSPREERQSGLTGNEKAAVFDLGPLGALAVNREKFSTLLDDNSATINSQMGQLAKKGLELIKGKTHSIDDKFWVRAFTDVASDPRKLSVLTGLFEQGVLEAGDRLEKNPTLTRRLASEGLDNTEKYLKVVGNFLNIARAMLKAEDKLKGGHVAKLTAGLDELQQKVKAVRTAIDRLKRESFQGRPPQVGERHAGGGEHEAQRRLQGSVSTINGGHSDGSPGVSTP